MNRLFDLFCLITCLAAGAQMPDTDLWLFDLKKDKTGILTAVKPRNITSRPGYDNQPSFSADGKHLFYVSQREDAQADIYAYHLKNKKITKVTNSIESEYSPAQFDKNGLLGSVVVEYDSAQRIHFIGAETGVHEKKLEFDSVGYYTCVNNDTLIYYKLTQPHSLRYHVQSSHEDRFIGAAPVRTFKAINRHSFIYGLKDTGKVVFYVYDFLLRKASLFAELEGMHEDIFFDASFGLMASSGSRILQYREPEKKWEVLFDLAPAGIKKITRFALSQDHRYLVVVDNL